MRHAVELTHMFAGAARPLVFVGPVGAGKTTLAGEAHRRSGRSGALVRVSAGELSETLHADTLFGHVSGAFTGASNARRGAYAEASGGTLLLDDLALMPEVAQACILRVTESGRYRPLGADKDAEATCQLFVATSVGLDELESDGRLLPDFRSRLGELIVHVPPLRHRKEEIMPLARDFARRYLAELRGGHADVVFSEPAQRILTSYGWPRNVRQLEGVVERAVLLAGIEEDIPVIRRSHLPDAVREYVPSGEEKAPKLSISLIESVLREVDGNQSEAARQLDRHRNTIGNYLRDHA